MDTLLRNPACSVASISDKCGLSTQQVYRILRDLEEEGIIYGNPVVLDLSKLGKKRFIIFAKRSGKPSDQTSLNSALYSDEFLKRIASKKLDIIPEDDYTCTGAFDMVTVFLADSTMEAIKYMDLLRHTAQGYFSSYSMSEVMFTTRKNMIMTPEKDAFVQYMIDIAEYGEKLKDPTVMEELNQSIGYNRYTSLNMNFNDRTQ